ncbi:MAG: fibronectin type III domain-containing protein, partial [Candidatus Latescibacteria bacterium]|nr:fibronectin type III domain-containing protein [Candidatus Latescibacterota bacterium]
MRLSLSGVNISPDGADFGKVRITRQLRGFESLTSAISGRLGVQLTDVTLANGLRGDVTGSVSTLSTDVYEASYSPNLFDLSAEDAAKRFIVLNDGLAGFLSPRLTAVLGHATRTYSNTISLDDVYQGSARSLDMRQGSLASGSFRLDVQDQTILPTNAFDVQVGANIGADGHLVVKGAEYVDRQESGFQLSVTGTVSDQAPLGDGLNFRNKPWNDVATAEFSNFLGLFGPDGEISFDGTLSGGLESITDATGNLKRLEIRVIKEETLQTSPILLSRRESVYEISADAERLRDIASTVVTGRALLEFMGGTPSRFEFEANTFSSILHRFFTRIYGFRRDVEVGYTVHETIQEQQPDSSFQVTVETDGVATQLQLRVGAEVLKGKRLKAETGVWINGRHYALEEYLDDQNTPQIAPSFQDIESYLLDQMEDSFDGAFSRTVVAAASGQNLLLQTTNALLTIPPNVLSPGTAVGNLNWSFYGNNSSVSTRALPVRTRKLSDGIRNKALETTGLRYGIGGFHHLTPEGTALGALATLAVTYDDQDITGLNETDLRIYANKGDVNDWVLIGGTVDTGSNTVTASIDTFWTYTVAPLAPGGSLVLAIEPDTLFAGASDTANVASLTILSVDSTTVEDGTQVTILTDGGTILAPDLDADMFGTQIATAGGKISFGLLPGEVSGLIHVEARTIFGNVRGEAILTVVDDIAPSAPDKPSFLTRNVDAIGLGWSSSSEPDLAGYRVYFDTDTSGTPYTGTASILGRASPVDIGFDTTAVLTGLSPGLTYYVAVASYDLSGNESVVSSELQVETASRATSTIDTLSREVVFDFGDATRISVAIDSGAVGQDSLTVTYFGAADPFPHEFSGFTSPLLYLEIT